MIRLPNRPPWLFLSQELYTQRRLFLQDAEIAKEKVKDEILDLTEVIRPYQLEVKWICLV